jgi:hypothetical protein
MISVFAYRELSRFGARGAARDIVGVIRAGNYLPPPLHPRSVKNWVSRSPRFDLYLEDFMLFQEGRELQRAGRLSEGRRAILEEFKRVLSVLPRIHGN